MKIFVVTPYFAPRVGGLENYALAVAKQLQAAGHAVTVVTSHAQLGRHSHETVEGLPVIRLAAWIRLSNTPINPLWYFQLRRLMRQQRPDAVIVHTPVPLIADMAARAAGRIPVVVTYHNDLAKNNRLLKLIIGLYWRLLGHGTLARADRIIATSAYYADTSPSLRPFRSKVAVVPPGVDTSRFHPGVDGSAVRHRLGDKPMVLFVASLAKTHAHKGLDLLLDAVASLRKTHPDLQVVVGGPGGDNQPTYERQAAELGIRDRVHFAGFIPDDELPAYYAAADVFVLPSTNQAEGFGMVLVEASACGTPVVGTTVGGIPAALATVGSPYAAKPTAPSIAAQLSAALTAGKPQHGQTKRPPIYTWNDAAVATQAALEAAAKPRVALIHNVVAPYRLAMFEELARTTNLHVLFTQVTIKDREWQHNLDGYTFDSQLLPSRTIGPVVFNHGGLRALRQTRFDVLITNSDPDTAPLSLTGLILAKLGRRPVIVWSEVTDDVVKSLPGVAYATGSVGRGLSRLASGLVNAYRRLFFNSAARILAFSHQAETFLHTHGVRATRIRRTIEIVPPELLPAPHTRPKRTGKWLLYVGYLNRNKNLGLLIDAFRDIADPDARLTIAGSGPEAQALKARAASDQRIHFAGYVGVQERAELYQAHDIFVLPTLRDCWGLVVNEAIHYGLAAIVTDTAAACELIDRQTGLVVPSDNRSEMTQAIQTLLADPARLKAMQHHNAGSPQVSDTAGSVKPFTDAIREVLA